MLKMKLMYIQVLVVLVLLDWKITEPKWTIIFLKDHILLVPQVDTQRLKILQNFPCYGFYFWSSNVKGYNIYVMKNPAMT